MILLAIIMIQFDPESEIRRPIKYLMRNKKTGEVYVKKIAIRRTAGLFI